MEQWGICERPALGVVTSHMRKAMLPVSSWTPPTAFPSLAGAKVIAFDAEAKDPFLRQKGPGYIRKDAYTVGWAIATDDGFSGYYPTRHEGGGNLDEKQVNRWVRDQMKDARQVKVASNAPYDIEAAWSDDIQIAGPIVDIQIAEALLDENALNYSTERLSKKYLGEGKEESLLKAAASVYGSDNKAKHAAKGELWRFHAKYVGPYAEPDATKALAVWQKQKPLLEREGLMRVFDVETRLLPIVFQMRLKGVRVDLERARVLSKLMQAEQHKLQQTLDAMVGFRVNVANKGGTLAKAFDQLHVEYPRTAAGNPSFVKEWLKACVHPVGKLVTQIRALEKLRRDFVDNLEPWAINGRIHAQFHQMRRADGEGEEGEGDSEGTRSGRFSSANPNLQQIPKRDKVWASLIRALFLAEKGAEWTKADMSQQEPRMLVHFANLRKLQGAAEAAMMYRQAGSDYYNILAAQGNVTRDEAKIIHLMISYGSGDNKVAAAIHTTREGGAAFRANFNARVPFVSALFEDCQKLADGRGYIKTLLGRRSHFELWEPAKYEKGGGYNRPLPLDAARAKWPDVRLRRAGTRNSLNRLIQGSAADQTKLGMLKLWDEHGIVPNLQVHDELDDAESTPDRAQKMKHSMETCVELTVPSVSECETGPNWGELKAA